MIIKFSPHSQNHFHEDPEKYKWEILCSAFNIKPGDISQKKIAFSAKLNHTRGIIYFNDVLR